MTKLTVETHESGGGTTIVLKGELIGPELAHLQHVCLSTLHQITTNELVLDMTGVVYIDSLSIGRLVALNSTALKQDKHLTLINPQSRVHDTLKMLNIDKLITIR